MANTQDQIDLLKKEVSFLSEKYLTTLEYLNKLLERKEQGQPLLDDKEVDKEIEARIQARAIKGGIVSGVYKGRYASVVLFGDGSLNITQYSHHLQKEYGDEYKPTTLNLSQETFFLILETMEFAEKKLILNRQEAVARLTNAKGIDFSNRISGV